MTGSKPKTHQRSLGDTSYFIETSQHEHGISIVVTVPGRAPLEDNERTFPTEAQALTAGDDIARELLA